VKPPLASLHWQTPLLPPRQSQLGVVPQSGANCWHEDSAAALPSSPCGPLAMIKQYSVAGSQRPAPPQGKFPPSLPPLLDPLSLPLPLPVPFPLSEPLPPSLPLPLPPPFPLSPPPPLPLPLPLPLPVPVPLPEPLLLDPLLPLLPLLPPLPLPLPLLALPWGDAASPALELPDVFATPPQCTTARAIDTTIGDKSIGRPRWAG
jgi:hypothetical protein